MSAPTEQNRRRRAPIAAVIVNYRTPGLVRDCLDSLIPEIRALSGSIVVVDNASDDGSAEQIESVAASRGWREVQVVEAEQNRGFAAGNNLGIATLEADLYLLLNSDTIVRSEALQRLTDALRTAPEFGAVGPRLEQPDGTPLVSCFRMPTPWSELIDAAQTGPISRVLSRWIVPIPPTQSPAQPDWTSFAAVLIRRELIEQIGPLDEAFFMYYEDVDYCRRARRAGWRIGHEPAARVVHLIGGSSGVDALREARSPRPAYFYAARRHYFVKTSGGVGRLLADLCWSFGWLVSWTLDHLGRRPPGSVPGELARIWRST